MPEITHALQLNGGTVFSVREGEEDRIRVALQSLNARERYSQILWRIPAGQIFEVSARKGSQEYIQCAGDFAARLVCEIREVGPAGAVQHVVGRTGPADSGWVVIPWDGVETRVKANEALSGEEVVSCFVEYFRTGSLPPGFTRRPIEL